MTADGDQLDAAVAALAGRFRAALDEPRHAGVDLDAAGVRALVDEPLPEHGLPVEVILDELVDRTAPGLVGSTGGRYLGYVTGGVLPAAAIAHAWAAAVDQNTGLWSLGPAATELEQVVLGWLADLLELPRGGAVFTSGAAGANLVSLAVARHDVGRRHGVDVNRDGVRALPALAVYGSTELHFTNVKALRTLGLGADCVRSVEVDADYRLDPGALEAAIARDRSTGVLPAIVIAHAGSPNTGAADPLPEIADLCAEHGLWLHVDGAFGAFFRLCPRTAPLVVGLERADSVTVDGHKWLNLPNGIGFAFLRDAALHHETFAGTAVYLTPCARSGCGSPRAGDRGEPPVARRSHMGCAETARAVGRRGARDALLRPCGRARRARRGVAATRADRPGRDVRDVLSLPTAGAGRGRGARRAEPADPAAPGARGLGARDRRHAPERLLAPSDDRQLADDVGRRGAPRARGRAAGRRAQLGRAGRASACTRCGVSGSVSGSSEPGGSASATAFATAAGAPTMPASPAPFTPRGLPGTGPSTSTTSTGGASRTVGSR